MSNIRRWADEHQYEAAPMQAREDGDGHPLPTVHLLWMTPDPLGAVAAMTRMYEGKPTYSLADLTDEDRRKALEQVQQTHLKAPLEAVKLHFFIEGVSRSFTHQMVRQRTAVYAQESLRFAVKNDLSAEVSLPPSIAALPAKHPTRQKWDHHMEKTEETYEFLVANGIPAEDARGVMPHAVTTRLNYVTDLRNLSDHAGNRLCTQAQFEWRIVFMEIVKAIAAYEPDFSWLSADWDGPTNAQTIAEEAWRSDRQWQFKELAGSGLFRPVCYQLGHCTFKADFDRSCTIRDRVDANARHGIPSTEWQEVHFVDRDGTHENEQDGAYINGIDPREWLLDPAAARLTSGGGGHD